MKKYKREGGRDHQKRKLKYQRDINDVN